MSRPISPDEISPADVALLGLLSWSGALLVTHDGIATRARMDVLIWRLAVAGGLLALLGMVQFVTKQVIVDHVKIPGLTQGSPASAYLRDGRIRPSGTAIHPLEYGAILAIILPLALHVAFHDRTRSTLVRWLPALAIGGVIAISSSRTAYLTGALAVLIAAIGWTRIQRIVILMLGAGGIVGLAAIAPNLIQSILNLFVGAKEDPSVTSRTDSIPVAWSFLSEHPLFGRGLGTFLPKYRIFDNEYLLLLVTVGVLGTLAFLSILVAALARLVKSFLSTTDVSSRSLTMSLGGALVSGFTSLAFFDAFAFAMTMGTVFLCLGLSGAVSRLLLEGDHSQRFGTRAKPTTIPGKAETAANRDDGQPANHSALGR
jgi:O-antigen ligase